MKPPERRKPQPLIASDVNIRILEAARAEIGRGERGGDNLGDDVRRYMSVTNGPTQGASWCAGFASYVAETTVDGMIDPMPVVNKLMAQFKQNDAYHQIGSDYKPMPGDFVFFNRGKESWMGHIGIVESVDPDGTIHTIEGNKFDPKFKGLTEGVDYEYSSAHPDKVRRVTYAPHEFAEAGLTGFGSTQQMVQARGLARGYAKIDDADREYDTPTEPAVRLSESVPEKGKDAPHYG